MVYSQLSLYTTLMSRGSDPLPWHLVWRIWRQPKICFFTWEAVCGKILSLIQLNMKGFVFANRCYLCHEYEEIMDHFLLCEKNKGCCGSFRFLFLEISQVIQGTISDSLGSSGPLFFHRQEFLGSPPKVFVVSSKVGTSFLLVKKQRICGGHLPLSLMGYIERNE